MVKEAIPEEAIAYNYTEVEINNLAELRFAEVRQGRGLRGGIRGLRGGLSWV